MTNSQIIPPQQRTVLTDIEIPFGRLVAIFIQIGLAVIPAAIIIGAIVACVVSLLFGTGMWGTGIFGMISRGM